MKTVFVIPLLILFNAAQSHWRLPVTIEAARNVQARFEGRDAQQRGTLYIFSGQPFLIRKGERFQMIKIYSEGECRIRFKKSEYDVSSCPWLEGFADPQGDIFRVVPKR